MRLSLPSYLLSMGDMISSCLLVLFLLSSPLTFLHLSNTVSSQSLQILSMHLRILFARWEASHCHNFSESSFLGPAIFSKVTKAFSQYVENINFLLGVNDFRFLHPYSFFVSNYFVKPLHQQTQALIYMQENKNKLITSL